MGKFEIRNTKYKNIFNQKASPRNRKLE